MSTPHQPGRWWVMDGRAAVDVDSAMVYTICRSLAEARRDRDVLYAGQECVIVGSETQRVVKP